MKKILERIIFSLRWLLYPVNIGLFLALLIYTFHFFKEVVNFIIHGFNYNLDSDMVILLTFVECSLLISVILMLIQSGYEIFIKEFSFTPKKNIPRYLKRVDSTVLKIKVALSISSLTLIQLLKDFINIDQAKWEDVKHHIYLHLVCLISALIMSIVWKLTHYSKGTK